MRKILNLAKELGAPLFAMSLPLLAGAQGTPSPIPVPNPPIGNLPQLVLTICNIIGWMFWLLVVLVIIFVLVGAYRYLTAAGDPEKVKKAGATLLYAAIAMIVALLAKGVPLIIASFMGANLTGTGC